MAFNRVLATGIGSEDEPTRAVSGDGAWLVLEDGRRVLDAMTSPAPLGHRHPRVLAAVQKALAEAPTIDEGWRSADREAAADELIDTAFAGEDWVGAVRFAITGSEANDLALSLTQALTGRAPLATRERAYHGMVGLSRDMTVQAQWHGGLQDRNGRSRPVPPSADVRTLPFPRLGWGEGMSWTAEQAQSYLAPSRAMVAESASAIVDYTQGGDYALPAYQDELARIARESGTLWIADEVVTGFGKTGRWFNFQHGERRPDIVTLGKPMGGGIVPAAAVVVSKDVLAAIGDASWMNYSALRAHPTAVAAAREFVRVIDDEGLVARAADLHHTVFAGMRDLAAAHPLVGRVDGRGLHWWIDLNESPDAAPVDGLSVAQRVAGGAMAAGVAVATSGETNALLISLPMIITDEEIRTLFTALDHGLDVAERALGWAAAS
jgi:4-aminobutyrate aminotransferase-like enzyme